jgi:hypothetical protein
MLGDFNAKLGTENTFKPTTGNVSLHQDNNDNGVRIVNYATSKNLIVGIMMFPHRNLNKYTWTSTDRKTHNQIEHVLKDKSWHSSILDARSFRGNYCNIDHYLRVAKVWETQAESCKSLGNTSSK